MVNRKRGTDGESLPSESLRKVHDTLLLEDYFYCSDAAAAVSHYREDVTSLQARDLVVTAFLLTTMSIFRNIRASYSFF